jgi:hypothetical protein
MDTGFFPWVQRPERGDDHAPNLAPMLKEEYSFTITLPLELHDVLKGDLYLYC